jgi:hypothetical protein
MAVSVMAAVWVMSEMQDDGSMGGHSECVRQALSTESGLRITENNN